MQIMEQFTAVLSHPIFILSMKRGITREDKQRWLAKRNGEEIAIAQ
jgi:hypothetical protein